MIINEMIPAVLKALFNVLSQRIKEYLIGTVIEIVNETYAKRLTRFIRIAWSIIAPSSSFILYFRLQK